MTAAEAIAYASCLRQRLRNPPNAVRDTEIDLGRQSAAARSALREKVARERIEAEQLMPPALPPKQKRNIIEYPKAASIRAQSFDTGRVAVPAERIIPIESYSKLRRIQLTVAESYCFGRLELLARRRGGPLIRARHVAMYLCTILTVRSLPEIGRAFNRDHSTILHARDKIGRLRKTDAKLNAEIEALIEKLGMTEDA